MQKINVLSLFGGIECGKIALDKLGIECENYFSSEVDKYAIQISSANHPGIIHLGDIKYLYYKEKTGGIYSEEGNNFIGQVDLLIGGSPCQDLSIAKNNGQGLQGEKSGLFFEYVRILNEVKPKYWLLENVASMKKADKDEISKILGVEPILINSSLVSAQNRKRLYWVGQNRERLYNGRIFDRYSLGINQPEDKEIFLKDILEDIPDEDPQWRPLDEKYITDPVKLLLKQKASRQLIFGQFRRTNLRVHADQDKSCTLTSNMGTGGNNVPIILGLAHRNRGEGKQPECNCQEKANLLTTVQTDSEILKIEDSQYFWRKLTVRECARLQTLPDTFDFPTSDSRSYKAIGNGWTVDVIAHILSFMKF